MGDLGEDYGAGIDALYFNEGFGLAIAKGKPGSRPDSIQTFPARTYPKILGGHNAIVVSTTPGDTAPLHSTFISREHSSSLAAE